MWVGILTWVLAILAQGLVLVLILYEPVCKWGLRCLNAHLGSLESVLGGKASLASYFLLGIFRVGRGIAFSHCLGREDLRAGFWNFPSLPLTLGEIGGPFRSQGSPGQMLQGLLGQPRQRHQLQLAVPFWGRDQYIVGMDPSETELNAIATLEDVRDWAGIGSLKQARCRQSSGFGFHGKTDLGPDFSEHFGSRCQRREPGDLQQKCSEE